MIDGWIYETNTAGALYVRGEQREKAAETRREGAEGYRFADFRYCPGRLHSAARLARQQCRSQAEVTRFREQLDQMQLKMLGPKPSKRSIRSSAST